jgi:hypothetical protein
MLLFSMCRAGRYLAEKALDALGYLHMQQWPLEARIRLLLCIVWNVVVRSMLADKALQRLCPSVH